MMSGRLSFGGSRLQASIMQRRFQDQQGPIDDHEEINRYLKDPLVDTRDCADVLTWWKVYLSCYLFLSMN